MYICQVSILLYSLVGVALASIGDQSEDFVSCVEDCNSYLKCSNPRSYPAPKYQMVTPIVKYTPQDFLEYHQIGYIPKILFDWDCSSNCNYQCTQFTTQNNMVNEKPVVQYFGKWPFIRIFGITEIFSVVFSLFNLYSNWINLPKIHSEYEKHINNEFKNMYLQYLILLYVSITGWIFSTLFHIRDSPLTETLDYYGAIAIIVCNFNTITIRYFELYKAKYNKIRYIFQFILFSIYILHLIKLQNHWDYDYNIKFNLVFGVGALILWCLHSYNVNILYGKNNHIYNNSIQLLPYETKIMSKLDKTIYLSNVKLIPILPIILNAVLIFGMSLELIDFVPIYLLIDAHSLWHFVTIFPTLIWYDWNIWDIELKKLSSDVNKFN
ncbi:protein Per1p [[Candida] anglica]|uniref:Post-GPI attachment to proteins factor 3 n=1 Tax=[Candida] anglica TaxID=148631 RepID=A0ABP0EBZ6_9ASCO